MRNQQLVIAAALAAAVFSANAAQNRMEPVNSPFTYEALGATPTLMLRRAAAPKAAEAPQAAAAVAPQSAQPSKSAAVPAPKAVATTRAAGAASTPFTYDALGATPHVEAKKQPARSEVQATGAAH